MTAEFLLLRRAQFVRRRGRERRQAASRSPPRRRRPSEASWRSPRASGAQTFMPRIRWRIQGECARPAIGRAPAKRSEAKRNENETGALFCRQSASFERSAKSAISRFRGIQLLMRRFVSPRDGAPNASRRQGLSRFKISPRFRFSPSNCPPEQAENLRRDAAAGRGGRRWRRDGGFEGRLAPDGLGSLSVYLGRRQCYPRPCAGAAAQPPRGSSGYDRRLRLHQHRSRHQGRSPGARRDRRSAAITSPFPAARAVTRRWRRAAPGRASRWSGPAGPIRSPARRWRCSTPTAST